MLNTTNNQSQRNSNQLLVPQSENVINNMKTEIANEFGVQLNGETSSRNNGRVGGEITKRLVALGQQALMNQNNNNIH